MLFLGGDHLRVLRFLFTGEVALGLLLVPVPNNKKSPIKKVPIKPNPFKCKGVALGLLLVTVTTKKKSTVKYIHTPQIHTHTHHTHTHTPHTYYTQKSAYIGISMGLFLIVTFLQGFSMGTFFL